MPTGANLRIRAYRRDDHKALIALFTSSASKTAAEDFKTEQIQTWVPDSIDRDGWATRLGRRPTLLAEQDGMIVGFGGLEPNGRIELMVKAEHHRREIASVLLTVIEDMARDRGLARLFADARPPARATLESNGFAVVAAQDVEPRGRRIDHVRMQKLLGEECQFGPHQNVGHAA